MGLGTSYNNIINTLSLNAQYIFIFQLRTNIYTYI